MSRPLAGATVISLRPEDGHAPLRHAVEALGGRLLPLSPWRLEAHADARTREALAAALAAPRVVFTSPMAVAAAAALARLHPAAGATWLAVGTGTAAALRQAGADALAPARMDSEGLLALPALQRLEGTTVGLVTAPGGREAITSVLQQRGARVLRADVYARVPLPPTPEALAALHALDGPAWLAVSSGAALQAVLAALPAEAVWCLKRAAVVAASDRLAVQARALGFAPVVVAASALPEDLAAAVAAGPFTTGTGLQTRRPRGRV